MLERHSEALWQLERHRLDSSSPGATPDSSTRRNFGMCLPFSREDVLPLSASNSNRGTGYCMRSKLEGFPPQRPRSVANSAVGFAIGPVYPPRQAGATKEATRSRSYEVAD